MASCGEFAAARTTSRWKRSWPTPNAFRKALGVRVANTDLEIMKLAALGLTFLIFVGLVGLYTQPLVTDLGGLLPPHWDPRVFSWVMASNSARLPADLATVHHGNAFYPYGSVTTYSEPLLTPTLVYAPVFYASGNPVLAYNVTLLVFWALSGVAMVWLVYAVTASASGAALAGVVFLLCPYQVEYYLEFQMHLSFGMPLALLAWYRFLVTQRWRALAAFLAAMLLTFLASLYYAAILTLAIAAFTAIYAVLRQSVWNRRFFVRAAGGGIALMVVLAPLLFTYLRTRREMGFERVLDVQPWYHYANVLTYLETRSTLLYRLPAETLAETSLFMGFVPLALVALAWWWTRSEAGPSSSRDDLDSRSESRMSAWLGRAALLTVLLLVPALLWSWHVAADSGARWARWLPVLMFSTIVVAAVTSLWQRGRALRHAANTERELSDGEWVRALLLLGFLFVLITLGPTVQIGSQRDIGPGIYGLLYNLFPFLHGLRVVTRFGVIVTLAVGMLAGFGAKHLLLRLPVTWRRSAGALLVLLVLAEYYSGPLEYESVPWPPASAAYGELAAQDEELVLVEVPLYADKGDDDAMLRATYHGKYLVNGISGFVPTFSRRLASELLESPAAGFPPAKAVTRMRAVYPPLWVLVHRDEVVPARLGDWERLASEPPAWVRHVGRFGEDDLFRLVDAPESAHRLERLFSYDFVSRHQRAEIVVSLRGELGAGDRAWFEATFNERLLFDGPLRERPLRQALELSSPYRKADANRLVLALRYRPGVGQEDPRYAIGNSGRRLGADVVATAQDAGSRERASLQVNADRWEFAESGFHFTVLDPADGAVVRQAVFASEHGAQASTRMRQFVRRLEPGAVVVVVSVGGAGAALTEDGARALRQLGGALDPRDLPRGAYALIGVKGAAGRVLPESLGLGAQAQTVGQAPGRLQLVLERFCAGDAC